MNLFSIILLSVALAMDAFAVSVSCGISDKQNRYNVAIKCAFSFGFFQSLMSLLGYALADAAFKIIEPIDHWVAFILLTFIGLKMIYETIKHGETTALTDFKSLIILSIATSIDAFVAGVTLVALDAPLTLSVILIGITTFVFSFVGVILGSVLCGTRYGRVFDVIGGIILIALGIKALF